MAKKSKKAKEEEADTVECPNCGEELTDEEVKSGECPHCGAEFEVDDEDEEESEETEEESEDEEESEEEDDDEEEEEDDSDDEESEEEDDSEEDEEEPEDEEEDDEEEEEASDDPRSLVAKKKSRDSGKFVKGKTYEVMEEDGLKFVLREQGKKKTFTATHKQMVHSFGEEAVTALSEEEEAPPPKKKPAKKTKAAKAEKPAKEKPAKTKADKKPKSKKKVKEEEDSAGALDIDEFLNEVEEEFSDEDKYEIRKRASYISVFMDKKKILSFFRSPKKLRVEFFNVKKIGKSPNLAKATYKEKYTFYRLVTKDPQEYRDLIANTKW